MRTTRALSEYKLSIFIQQITINHNLTFMAHIANHIPVDGTSVDAPGLNIAVAKRHMKRPANLFIEQDIAGKACNAVVRANREFAQIVRTRVALDLRQ